MLQRIAKNIIIGHAICVAPIGFAMKSAVRFSLFVCIASALCLVVGCQERPTQSRGGGVNLFDPNRGTSTPRREVQRPTDPRSQQVIQALREHNDPDRREFDGRSFRLYGIFLGCVAVLVAGLLYWQLLKRKRSEWELSDPMALVKELNLAHQLSDQEKRLMQELSDRNALPSPLKLFVEPKFLLEALESDSFVSARDSVLQLLSKLFDITVEVNTGTFTVQERQGFSSSITLSVDLSGD